MAGTATMLAGALFHFRVCSAHGPSATTEILSLASLGNVLDKEAQHGPVKGRGGG